MPSRLMVNATVRGIEEGPGIGPTERIGTTGTGGLAVPGARGPVQRDRQPASSQRAGRPIGQLGMFHNASVFFLSPPPPFYERGFGVH